MPAEVLSRAGVVALTVVFVLAATSCGGSGSHPIKIAFISDCTSQLTPDQQSVLAGAELPFIRRGAKLRRAAQPSSLVTEATVAGKPVQLLFDCESYPIFTTLIRALDQVVENDGADIVVGTNLTGEGLVVKQYARKHPEVTFLTRSGEQSTTLKSPVPNLFSLIPDSAQESAGLGAYAYRTLKLRNVVTVGENDPYGWAEVAGFAAEFCSLGGNIVESRWSGNFKSLAPVVREIPSHGVDGVVLPTTYLPVRSFMATWAKRHPSFGDRLLVNADNKDAPLSPPLTQGMLGLVGVSSWPLDPTAESRRFHTVSKQAFPHGADPLSYDAMEPVLEALGRARGDLSHFRQELARLHFSAPNGPMSLDSRRQVIAPTYLRRVERNAQGKLVVRQIALVPNVEQTYGGYFNAATHPPSRHPLCRRGTPPAWVKSVPTTK